MIYMNKQQHTLIDRYQYSQNEITYSVEVYETAAGTLYRTSDGVNLPTYSFQPPELITDRRIEE